MHFDVQDCEFRFSDEMLWAENLVLVDMNAVLELLQQVLFRGLQILDDPVLVFQWFLMVKVPLVQDGV